MPQHEYTISVMQAIEANIAIGSRKESCMPSMIRRLESHNEKSTSNKSISISSGKGAQLGQYKVQKVQLPRCDNKNHSVTNQTIHIFKSNALTQCNLPRRLDLSEKDIGRAF